MKRLSARFKLFAIEGQMGSKSNMDTSKTNTPPPLSPDTGYTREYTRKLITFKFVALI